MSAPRPSRSSLAAFLSVGLFCIVEAPAGAQTVAPARPAPQAMRPAPQAIVSGQYASPQLGRPCACYYPQGYCPFPSGSCWTFPRGYCTAFPQGNCIAVRPSSQWPAGSSQLGSAQVVPEFTPAVIGD